jgi:hypothetical protein
MRDYYNGFLIGWDRHQSASGIVLSLQIAENQQEFVDKNWSRMNLALNDRQLRSLARDLERAAKARGIKLHAPDRRVLGKLSRAFWRTYDQARMLLHRDP